MLRISIILQTVIFLSVNSLAQSPCGNLANLPGKWTQGAAKAKDAQIVKNINSTMSLFLRSVSGFSGAQANA